MRCTVVSPDGKPRDLPSKVTTYVSGDHVIETQTPGGGGWGDPQERDVEAVRRDVVEGLVSPQRARDVYGVAINAHTHEVDDAETQRLRGVGA